MGMNINRFAKPSLNRELKINSRQENEQQANNKENKNHKETEEKPAEFQKTYADGMKMLGMQNRALMNIDDVIKSAVQGSKAHSNSSGSKSTPAEIAKSLNLTLVEDDEYENKKGHIIAEDADGNIYDYNSETNEFILRTYDGIKKGIMSRDNYFTGTDLVRFVNKNIKLAAERQNLTLVEDDEYENNAGHTIATDSEGNIYDYNSKTNEFVLRTYEGIKERIMSGDDYFTGTDLVRFANRNNGKNADEIDLAEFEARIGGGEFDEKTSANDLVPVVEQYISALIQDLKTKMDCSDEFLEDIENYVTDNYALSKRNNDVRAVLKEVKSLFNEYVNVRAEREDMLNDSLFIQGHLETYRDELYYMNCPSELFNKIMDNLKTELSSYYLKNGANGLTEHLNKVFEELVKQYLNT